MSTRRDLQESVNDRLDIRAGQPQVGNPMHVLVVDDEPDLCALIADGLIDEGHQVTCVKDGAAALQAASTTTYDLVLADVRLPHVDGLTLFRRLRTQ